MFCYFVASCSIEALAYTAQGKHCWSYPDVVGYIKLNGVAVWRSSWCNKYPSYRGINIFLIDPYMCSVQENRQFDTYASSSAANNLTNYLQLVGDGVIIVGVSADEATGLLTNALPALLSLGVEVSDVQYRGSFGFVAQKGFPTKTALRKVLTEAESRTSPAHLGATVTGIHDLL